MNVPTITLNNGVDIPALGFGIFQTPPDDTGGRGGPEPRSITLQTFKRGIPEE